MIRYELDSLEGWSWLRNLGKLKDQNEIRRSITTNLSVWSEIGCRL